jgi:hypothetical protein
MNHEPPSLTIGQANTQPLLSESNQFVDKFHWIYMESSYKFRPLQNNSMLGGQKQSRSL